MEIKAKTPVNLFEKYPVYHSDETQIITLSHEERIKKKRWLNYLASRTGLMSVVNCVA